MRKIVKICLLILVALLSLTAVTACAHTHDWNKWSPDNGSTHTHSCACGESETKNHVWDEGAITKDATCKEKGIKTYTCADCGKTKTETVEKLTTHVFGKWTYASAQTHSHACSICGLIETHSHNLINDLCSDCGYTNNTAMLMDVQNATVDFDNYSVFMLVDKTTSNVNLSNTVKVSANSSWKLYTSASDLIPTKIAALSSGENKYLLVVTSSDGLQDTTYAFTIYKSFEIPIKYYDVYGKVIHTETADTGYEYEVKYVPQITGYTFNRWEMNGEQTTAFTPYRAAELYADCTANDYTFVLNANGGEAETSRQQVTFDGSYTLPVPTKTGYTFTGWYAGDTKITDANGASKSNSKFSAQTDVAARWQINTYKVTLNCDGASHGTVTGGGKYDYGAKVTVTANTYARQVFIGWYNGETLLHVNPTYTFVMSDGDVNYTAKWCTVTTETNISGSGSITDLDGAYYAGEYVTLNAVTFLGYDWLGWYNGDKLITADKSCTVVLPQTDTTYTAKYAVKEEMLPFKFAASAIMCGIAQVKDNTAEKVIIPQYVTYVRNSAFEDCGNLKSIEVSDGNTEYSSRDGILYNKTKTKLVYVPRAISGKITIADTVTYIYSYAFKQNGLTSVIIPDSVTSIGAGAFEGCNNLESITVPFVGQGNGGNSNFGYIFGAYDTQDNSQYVPSSLKTAVITGGTNFAFENCSNLTSITIPESVAFVNNYAFRNCSALTNVSIPNSVTSIAGQAFDGCDNLQYNPYGNGLYLGNGINPYVVLIKAASTDIASCSVNENTKIIYAHAFDDCSNLTDIDYFGTIEQWCNIKTLNNLTAYGSNNKALSINGQEVTELVIPNTVTSIPSGAFAYTNITSVSFEDNSQCTSIGFDAFWNCSNLTSVTIPQSVTSIDVCSFGGTNGCNIANVNYLGTIEDWCKIDGLVNLMYFSGTNTKTFSICGQEVTELVIPNTVTSIPSGAFAYTIITGVTFEENSQCTGIGDFAFSNCRNLTNITIPDSVSSVGKDAFLFCSNLTVYCEAQSKPDGWDINWNAGNRPVVWNCSANNP